MRVEKLSRRQVVAGSAAIGLVAAPFVRSANAAGTLTIGLWDHWVPGANEVQSAIIKEWADKEKVDVQVDFITSQANKLLVTLQAEATARSGHDIMEFTNWESAQMNAALEPVDDVVKSVVAKNGPIDPAVEYLGKFEGKWLGVPMTRGTLLLGCCSRFDLMKEHARHRRPGALPGRQAAQRRKLDLGRLPGGGRKVPKGRPCLRPAARLHHRHQPVGRRLVPGLWRGSHGCQGQRHGEVGRRPPGARVRQEARRILSSGRAVLGRCVEQQVAALRQGRR